MKCTVQLDLLYVNNAFRAALRVCFTVSLPRRGRPSICLSSRASHIQDALELVRIVYQTKHPGVGAQVKLVGGMGGDLALISSCPGLDDGQNPRAAAAKQFLRLQESI